MLGRCTPWHLTTVTLPHVQGPCILYKIDGLASRSGLFERHHTLDKTVAELRSCYGRGGEERNSRPYRKSNLGRPAQTPCFLYVGERTASRSNRFECHCTLDTRVNELQSCSGRGGEENNFCSYQKWKPNRPTHVSRCLIRPPQSTQDYGGRSQTGLDLSLHSPRLRILQGTRMFTFFCIICVCIGLVTILRLNLRSPRTFSK
jgi:hypothetical protein